MHQGHVQKASRRGILWHRWLDVRGISTHGRPFEDVENLDGASMGLSTSSSDLFDNTLVEAIDVISCLQDHNLLT